MRYPTIAVIGTCSLLISLPVLLAQHAPAPGEGTDRIILSVNAKTPESIEEMLEAALRSNPDVLLAEAKLRQAQAELNQARLKVTQSVATLYYERKKQRELKNELGVLVESVKIQVEAGRGSQDKLRETILSLAEAQAQAAQIDAQIRYVLGLGGNLRLPSSGTTAPTTKPAPRRRPEIPEKFRRVLETPLKIQWEDMSLADALQALQSATQDELNFLIDDVVDDLTVTLRFPRPVPLRSVLVAFTDVYDDLAFVFREYGVLVTLTEEAQFINAPVIPVELPLEVSN